MSDKILKCPFCGANMECLQCPRPHPVSYCPGCGEEAETIVPMRKALDQRDELRRTARWLVGALVNGEGAAVIDGFIEQVRAAIVKAEDNHD